MTVKNRDGDHDNDENYESKHLGALTTSQELCEALHLNFFI